MSRNTQGVRVMNLREGDRVSSLARVTEPQPAMVEGDADADAPSDAEAEPAAAAEPTDDA